MNNDDKTMHPLRSAGSFEPRGVRTAGSFEPRGVLIVGSMAFDDLEFPRPIPDPECPGRAGTTFENVLGGAATYAALAVSPFAPVRAVAVVGDDFPGDILERLRGRGIGTEGVERARGKTFRWRGRYHDDLAGRDTLDTQLNVFADFRPKLPASYADSPLVLLGNIHPRLQLDVLDQAASPHLVLADTMNFWISGESETLAEMLKRIDVLVINDEEARQLSGIDNIARAARDILARGPGRLVIKRGEYGSLYFDEEGVFAAPALLLEQVCDPTGAGDSFAGGLLGYLATQPRIDHATMRRAMLHGTATASYCVEALGTSGLWELTPERVARRVKEILALFQMPD
jgi:sugar/nucleoside kinase (ribokinase family)